jgi:dCTP deaminase
MILPAQHIRKRFGLIEPFCERSVAHGMTFGLSVSGYDVRIKQRMTLKPGDFRLASTVERFNMPTDLMAQVGDKSTWARRGLAVQNTWIEPGWCGWLTIELSNHGGYVLEIEAGMPIAQIIFMQLLEPAERGYDGKYQAQADEPVSARLERSE